MKLRPISICLWAILFSLCFATGCSHEQDASIDEDGNGDPVAIRFGEGMPRIAPTTKALGPIDNWNPAQDLYVYGIARKGVNAQATAEAPLDLTGGILINNVKAESAPSPNENPSVIRESITVYSDPDLQIPFFYAPDRRYEFFGYYVDDAVENPSPTVGDDSITLPFVIDGSQDIMVASTDKEADAALATQEVSFDRLYSATSARRGVVPNLVFSHQLSRFNVQVRSGSKPETTNNMRLSYLRVQSATEGTLVIATKQDKESGGILDPANPQFLDLQRYGHTFSLADNVIPTSEWTELGDVLVMPGEEVYKMKVGIVQMGYTAEGIPAEVDYDIDLSKLVVDSEPYAQPGIQYNVKIVIYGLEEINVSVTLVAWEEVGEMFVDPDGEGSYIPVSSIELSEESLTLQPGESATLTATVYPSDASDRYVSWSSSNKDIATVNQSGVVTAVAPGEAIITARAGNKTRACSVTVEGEPQETPVPEAVDLGLSVKWASFNVGAASPEEFGGLYAWGEIEMGTQSNRDWNTYKWCEGTEDSLIKYNYDSWFGFVDNITRLEPDDDVAHVMFGEKWRTPTAFEMIELMGNCTWTPVTAANHEGITVTSNINGKSIFLPAAGIINNEGRYCPHVDGNYWTSDLNERFSNSACYLYFNTEGYVQQDIGYWYGERCRAFSIRPVYGDYIAPESMTLNKSHLLLSVGESEQLTATIKPDNASKGVVWRSSDKTIVEVFLDGSVTAVAPGTATITARAGSITMTCTVIVKREGQQTPVPDAVDLGLSVKWASLNIGAAEPEEFGGLYAWGETEIGTQSNRNWTTYKWCGGTWNSLTKYNYDSSSGFVDNITHLNPEDDVAYVMLGENWRIPTAAEMIELIENCTWTPVTTDNHEGITVTSNINGKSIFLPAAGIINNEGRFRPHVDGNYWTSNLNEYHPDSARHLYFNTNGEVVYGDGYGDRYRAFSIRPVYGEYIAPESIMLNKSSLLLSVGDSEQLTASITPDNASDKTVAWRSSDGAIATVDSYGVVTAVASGTATITACVGDITKDCSVIVLQEGMIDLGLNLTKYNGTPYKLYWASCNLGASKPEEYGDYFAWGDASPYYEDGYAQSDNPVWKTGKEAGYDWSSYQWALYGDWHYLTKYSCNSGYWGGEGEPDNVSDYSEYNFEDDPARVILGGKWRTPKWEELLALMQQCEWTFTSLNGVWGYWVSNKNSDGSAGIFLPAAGRRMGLEIQGRGDTGRYWSSSLIMGGLPSGVVSRLLAFDASEQTYMGGRTEGFSVRAVYSDYIPVAKISLDLSSLTMAVGESVTLTASVVPNDTSESTRWTIYDNGVATVDQNGKVTATSEGSTTVTVMAGDKYATCTINVEAPAGSYPDGAAPGIFSIGEKNYLFAKGNLKYNSGTDQWSFSEDQVSDAGGTFDRPTVEVGASAKIINGGNTAGLWRLPTIDEWTHFYGNAIWAIVGTVEGLVILPSDKSFNLYNVQNLTISEWNDLEAQGAIFLKKNQQGFSCANGSSKTGTTLWSSTGNACFYFLRTSGSGGIIKETATVYSSNLCHARLIRELE